MENRYNKFCGCYIIYNMSNNDNKQIKKFTFTYNNYDDKTEEYLKSYYEAYCNYMIYGHEIAPTTGTKHLQGYIELKKYRRFKQITQKDFQGKAHIERALGNYDQNKVYCSKTNDYVEYGTPIKQGSNKIVMSDLRDKIKACKTYKEVLEIEGVERHLRFAQEYFNSMDRRNPELFKDIELKDWQGLIVDYFNKEGDNRTILFVLDRKGGQGKTFLSNYLYNTRDDIFYTTNGKTTDILFNYSKSMKHNIIYDCTRKIKLEDINYDAVENLINPIMTSNKYNSMTLYRAKKANLVIFSNDNSINNVKQLTKYLSEDRIKILDLGQQDNKIVNYTDYITNRLE